MHTNIGSIPFFGLKAKREAHSRTIGYIALAVMILASSTYPAFGKKLTMVFAPLSMLFISEFLSGFFAIFSFGIVPTLKRILAVNKKEMCALIVFAVTNGMIGPFLWFNGLSLTAAVNADLFGRSEMILLVIFSVIFLKEPLKRAHLFGGSIIILGIVTVALRGFTNGIVLQFGDLLILLSAVSYGTGATVLKKYLHDLPPEAVIVTRACSAILLFFALEPFMDHTLIEEVRQMPASYIGAFLGFGFVSRFLNVFSFYESIERLPVATVSLTATLSIVSGMIFTTLYLGTPIYWYQIAGGLLVILGAVLMQLVGIHKKERHLLTMMKSHHRHHW